MDTHLLSKLIDLYSKLSNPCAMLKTLYLAEKTSNILVEKPLGVKIFDADVAKVVYYVISAAENIRRPVK